MGQLVLVSGAPGAGKSALARPLAALLGLPLLSKDVIKESLFDTLGHVADDELASSRQLGGAAMELLWRLAAQCPAVVLEANFRSQSAYERGRVLDLTSRPVEVYCRVPPAVAAERYARRGATDDHHPVHVARTISADLLAEFQRPFGLGPVIEVDTTGPVDVEAVAAAVRAALTGTASSERRRPGIPSGPTRAEHHRTIASRRPGGSGRVGRSAGSGILGRRSDRGSVRSSVSGAVGPHVRWKGWVRAWRQERWSRPPWTMSGC